MRSPSRLRHDLRVAIAVWLIKVRETNPGQIVTAADVLRSFVFCHCEYIGLRPMQEIKGFGKGRHVFNWSGASNDGLGLIYKQFIRFQNGR
jgi:hypothetical protein